MDDSAKPPTSNTAMVRREPTRISHGVRSLDGRVSAADLKELVVITRVREEFIRQDERAKDRDHLRSLEKVSVVTKAGLPILALAVGTLLVLQGFSLVGFMVLGAALYGLAPDLVSTVIRRVFSGDKDNG